MSAEGRKLNRLKKGHNVIYEVQNNNEVFEVGGKNRIVPKYERKINKQGKSDIKMTGQKKEERTKS